MFIVCSFFHCQFGAPLKVARRAAVTYCRRVSWGRLDGTCHRVTTGAPKKKKGKKRGKKEETKVKVKEKELKGRGKKKGEK